MPAQWTGAFIGKLHVNSISAKEFAEFARINPKYLSVVLNGKREPKNAEQRFNVALAALIAAKEIPAPKE